MPPEPPFPDRPVDRLARAPLMVRLGAAALLVGIAYAVRVLVLPAEYGFAFLTFYPAIALSFLYCGNLPGVLATLASTTAALTLMLPRIAGSAHPGQLALACGIFMGSCTGIGVLTNRLKTALRSAQATSQRLELVVHDTPAMIQTVDARERLLTVSELWLFKLGYTREEVLGRAVGEFMTPRSRDLAQARITPGLLANGRIEQVEFQMLRKDGSPLDVLYSAVLERDAAGAALRAICVLIDISARKRAEERLADSERRYRALVEDQSEMVSLVSPEGTLRFVNHAHARLFGRLPEDMIGHSVYETVPEEEHAEVARHFAEACATEGMVSVENRVVAADGSGPRWISWSNRALRDAHGTVTAIHSVGRDITEQKTLQSQLEAKAGEIEDLYDNAPCGYHSVGASGTYLKINATELGWLGCRRAEVLGQASPLDFVAPADLPTYRAAFERAKATGEAQKVDCLLMGRHGSHRDVSINISVVCDDDGSFLMTRSVMFDVTAQKEAERALQRLYREQHAMLQSELFGIARLRDRHFVWANRGLCQILGHPEGGLDGRSTRVMYPGEDAYLAFGTLAYPVLRAGGTFRGEIAMQRLDGSPLWVEMTGVLVDAAHDESLWVFSDVTARKQAELALHSSRSLLERTGAIAGVGGWELDLRSSALSWTAETCRIHGVPADFQPDLARALAFYAPQARPAIEQAVATAMSGGPGFDLELQLVRADSRWIWVRAVGSVEFEGTQPVRLVGALQDVTTKVEQISHIEHLYSLSEQQRKELAVYRDRSQSEAELAGFLLSRLSRLELLEAADVQYLWQPAESFSGDIIAVAESSAGDTYGMLADATGHGLAAAINLVPLTTAFYAMATKGFNLVTISEQLNKVVKDYSLPDRFVAVTLARFQHRERLLEVMNAGNPDALLLDGERRVLREFHSGSIPLGILDRNAFRPLVETIELRGQEALLMFSDGLIEANDAEGRAFGRAGVDQAIAAAGDGGALSVTLERMLNAHAGGLAPADDVSVLVLRASERPQLIDSPGVAEGPLRLPASEDGAPSPAPRPASLVNSPAAAGWSLELSFSIRELRVIEPVPLVVDLARTFGLPPNAESPLFTVMSELVQNGLEHGVLDLDSTIKHAPDGFEQFLRLREERLRQTAQGELCVAIRHLPGATGGGRLHISVRDSGAGFDHVQKLRELERASRGEGLGRPSGRGLLLLRSLCESVRFNGAGNQTSVELVYT